MFSQYRLIVPRTRNYLEVCHFLLLLVFYLYVMADRDPAIFGGIELLFIVSLNDNFELLTETLI